MIVNSSMALSAGLSAPMKARRGSLEMMQTRFGAEGAGRISLSSALTRSRSGSDIASSDGTPAEAVSQCRSWNRRLGEGLRVTQGSAGVEPPAAKRPVAQWRGLALGDQVRALRWEVEDLQDALVRRLVDHLIRQRHEYFVEEPGAMKSAQDLFAALARQVAHASFGEQTLVRASKAYGFQDSLRDDVDRLRGGSTGRQRCCCARRAHDDHAHPGGVEDREVEL